MTIAAGILPEFDDEMARTRKVLAAVPQTSLDWKPGESLRTIGWNANHLSEIVGWSKGILEEDEFDIAPVDGPRYETPSLADPAAIVAAFDANVIQARAAIAAATDAQMAEPWSMKMGGQTLFTMPKGACLRTWVLNHSVHHRGILSVYLRMNGVELTPVYDA
ncbi:DinB family protein [Lignipirellula cremea]|uniref:DinB superfamily protein n=1 Tax=Lignipirellula cremea TaxID=2528010 RepID=A0A518DL79_9BACT|nr:DinB family protein [Lignipirellula cremea]QDU92581.1 DinB superfamily protein [Lignipirellula cremea]